MGTLKRIGSTGQEGSREQTTGGRLRRIDTGETITYNPDPVRSLPNVDKITGNATQQDRSAVQTASGTLRKAGRPTSAGKLVRITSPEREAESRAEELRTLRDEAHQEFLNFRGAEITAGATGMPTEPYAGQRYRTAEEAYQAWQDYDRQYAEFRNQYYQEENERQQARLAGDTAMQASFARADEIRAALNRIQSLEQTRAAAPGPMTEDAVSQALQEIVGQYGLSQEDGRDLTTARKALEAQLLDETDRLSAAGYDYERMTEYQRRQQTAAEAEQQRQQTAAWAEEHPVLASIASVAAAPLQAIDIPRLIASGGGNEDDLRTYTPADPNSALVTGFVTTVRDTVSKQIEENTDWDLFGQNVASFLYNTGLSVGDSALQVGLLGPWATYLMGASAASQQAVNVLERGGSNTQAFWGGLAAGAAEAVFEKFSVDRLLRARSVNSVKDLLRETAKQAGTEASEEMLTEVANILSDTAIMGESSDFEQLVTQYQLMGMGENEARKQAYLDSLSQVVWAGVGGALSGAAMGGGLGGVDLAGRAVQQRQQQTTSRAIDDAYATMQREGLFSPAARQAAGQAQQRIDEADRREARAFNNNYYGQPRLPELRLAQEQNQEQPAEQRPQDAPAAVNVAELEQSAAAAGAAEADTRAAAEISQALGREIRFYDGAQRQDPSARANGYFDGDTIYVNSRSANPVAQIISHELTHSVELADAYQDLSSLVFDRIQRTGGDLEQLRQEKQALYAANGVSLASQEMIDQEIVAEYVEQNLLTNEQEILDLTRENPTLGQRILDWIDRILARLGNSSAQERAFLTTARDTYARALEQTRTSQETGQQQSTQQTAPPAAQTAPAGQRTERQTEPQEQGQEAAPRQQEARPEPEAEPAAPEADQERQRRREEIRQEVRTLREDYAAGRISDEEFDEAVDAIMEEEGLEDVSMLGRYSFGGQNARRADLETLDRAKEMERQGVAMETIFRETGWYTGADGKWRFEIDDSGMEYSRWGDLNRSDRAEYARFRELEGKFIAGSITLEEQNELRQLIDQGHGPGRAEEQQTLQLSDFVRHDELYQNYPQLRRAELRFADLPDGTYGTYNTEANTITLDNSLRSSPEDTLVHEIQHAIQTAEGFAGGSSPSYWRTPREAAIRPEYRERIREARARLREVENKFRQEWPNDTINLENAGAYYAWDELYWKAQSEDEQQRYLDRMNVIEEAAREGGWEELLDEYYSARAERDAAISAGLDARYTPYDAYFNTAGEIEARDAAQRRQLTPEQRRETMPNTGDENTVFVDSLGTEYSADAAEPVDSQAFKDWFGDWTSDRANHSQVVDDQGRPLIVYHGTGTNIEEFLPEFTGQGNDQYGSGFYFTTDRETAEGYTTRTLNDQSKPGGTDNPNVIPAYLNIRNPLVVEARETPNLYQIEVPASQAAKIIGKMPDIMDPENSILGDFFDDYWESGPKRSMINRLAREYDWTLRTLATDIFRDHPTEYRQAVRDVLGYDGVQVNFPSGEKRFIAWFPNQIKHATENSGAFSASDNRIRYSISDRDSRAEPSDNPLPSPDQDETQGAEQSYFDTLPRRVQTYLNRAENRLISRVGDQLNVPRMARREYLKGIARQLTEEYLQQGRVSQETMDRMFDEAYDQGVVVDREFYDEYKDLRDYLRKANLQISQEDASDIQDFNDFRKSNFGRLNISTKSGRTNIDQVYQELSARWPEFFNEQRESAPSDQLVRMAEVAQSFQIAEKSLSDYYGDQAADYRTWAKNDFEAAVTDALASLRNARRYIEGRPAEDTSQAPTTMEEVAQLWANLKEARRTYERAAARNLLTDHDEVQVGRLLRGETELQYLDPDTENVRGITEVYQAKQEYERISRLLRQWNQSRKAGLRSQAEQLLQTANEWKDKKSGILYARETMERNIRDIVPDEQLADQIIETYFAPVHRAAADANRLKNRYRDQVRSMNLSRNVAEGNTVSEAHAVQLLGEAEDNIRMIQQSRGRRRVRDGKTLEEWQAVVNDLWAENPNLDQQKIRSAVAEFRTIYDELFQQMNDTRIRNGYEPVNYRQGYFPHFQPGDGDGIMAQFGRALGIGTEVTALPTTINGMTHAFRPGIRWFGNAQERLGFNTAYDAVEGFDRYIEGVADVIYQTDNIQRLRALATEIRYRTGDEGIRKQIDRIRDDPSLDDEDKRNRIEKIVEDGRFALSNFVVDLDEYTNLLANKKSRADRDMEQRLGRGAYNVVRALESRVAANMVAINPASWLTNFIPLTQGGALLDRGYLLRGMWETLQAYKESDGLVERSAFLTNRRGSDPILSVYEQGAEPTNRAARRLRNASIAAGRIGDVLSSPMSYIDNFTADSLVRARYRQNLAKGMSDDAALADADAFAASVMADRSKGATPTMFSRTNPVSKLFTQFQLEVNNQLSYVFKDIPRERRNMGVRALAAALLKFALGAWLYDEVYEFFIGRRPALDPIGILNDTVGDLTGWEVPNLVELGVGAATGDAPSWQVERQGLYDTLANLGTAAAEELPFIGGLLGGGRLPIGSAIPDFATLARAATDDEWDPSKRIAEAWDELQKPLTYLATPFGGGQLKRIYEAIDAVRRGGVYSLDAEGEEQLQYPVYNDTWQQAVANALMGSVFGTTALGTGRDWVESGFDTLGARQTAAYQGMVDAGVPGEDAYALLKDLQGLSAQEERKTLRESAVSGAGKSVVYYGLMASDKEKALMDALTDMDADMGEVTETLMAMKDAGMATGLAASNGRRSALQEAALTDEQKIQIYREMISDSRDDDIQSFQDAGMTFDQFLEAQMNYAFMEEEYDQHGNPAVEFHRWVDEQNLTDEQKATVKEAFQYYSQIPQSAGYYDKLTAAGLPEEEAYLLNQELDALEPEDGADSVSSLQRQQTVVNSGISQTDQLAALGTMMPESEFGKVQTGTAYGVTPKAYVDLKAALPRYDSDGNGSFNQAEVTAAINSMGGLGGGLSNSQKAALWQLYNKSWSAKNNPFSVSIGQQVRDALNQDEEASELSALGRTSDDLPGLSLPSLD